MSVSSMNVANGLVDSMLNEILSTKSNIKDIKTQNIELQSEVMELTELLNNRMETLDQLQLKHKELKEKYEEDILLKNDEKSNILEQKEAELERALNRCKILEEQHEQYKISHTTNSNHIHDIEIQARKAETRARTAELQLASLRSDNSDLKRKLEDNNSYTVTLEAAHEEMLGTINELELRLKAASEHNDQLIKKESDLKYKLTMK